MADHPEEGDTGAMVSRTLLWILLWTLLTYNDDTITIVCSGRKTLKKRIILVVVREVCGKMA